MGEDGAVEVVAAVEATEGRLRVVLKAIFLAMQNFCAADVNLTFRIAVDHKHAKNLRRGTTCRMSE